MEGWAEIAGSICGGLVVLLIVGSVVAGVRAYRQRARTLRLGAPTYGWVVQASAKLAEDGMLDEAALVLISPDEDTANDEEVMNDLVDMVLELKGTDPDDPDDAFVAALMNDWVYIQGKRDRLPKSLTEGRKVYLAHVRVFRPDLPLKKLVKRKLACAVIWDDPKSLICTRPLTLRHPEKDD